MIIYDNDEMGMSGRNIFVFLSITSSIPIYYFVSAISRGAWFSTMFWILPSFVGIKLIINAYLISNRMILRIYLKKCGTKIVVVTVSGKRFEANIKDICKADDAEEMIR